jgi:hypothetical protein
MTADLDRHGIAAGPLEEVQHLQFHSVASVIDEIPSCIFEGYVFIPPWIADQSKFLVVDFDV